MAWTATDSNEKEPLELARHLWKTHLPQEEDDEQRMAYDYVPDWLLPYIPKLYSQDGEHDPVVWLKFFLPEGRWTFYVTEYSEVAPDETPDLFFGYMASPLGEMYDELCYMTLEQIEEIRGPHLGSRIERDLWWTPKYLSEVKAELNPRPVPEEHLNTIFDTEIGENIWWNREKTVVLATVEKFYYRCDKPSVAIRRKGGVVNHDGTDVSFEGAFDFDLETYQRLDVKKTLPPEDTIIIEPGDTVVIASDYSVPAHHVISPKRNTCRTNRKVIAGDMFKLLYFFKSTGGTTHGSVYAAVENDKGYELYIPIYKIALTDDQAEAEVEVKADDPAAIEADAEEITAEADAEEITAEADAEAKLRKQRKLPDNIPLFIKIDLGRAYGWADAEVTRVKGRWLYYALCNGNGNDTCKRKGKVQIIGRDIVWEPSAADETTVRPGGQCHE